MVHQAAPATVPAPAAASYTSILGSTSQLTAWIRVTHAAISTDSHAEKCRPIFGGIRSMWGYRCGDDCGKCVGPVCFSGGGCGALNGGGGCDGGYDGGCSCGAEVVGPACGCEAACGCEPSCGLEPSCGFETGGEVIYGGMQHEVIDGGEYIVDGAYAPTEGVTIQPAQQPYKPERTRKIFNPRPRVATGDGRSVGY